MMIPSNQVVMAPAGGEGGAAGGPAGGPSGAASGGAGPAGAEGGDGTGGAGNEAKPEATDWKAKYAELESERSNDRAELERLRAERDQRKKADAGDDFLKQLELRDQQIAELQAENKASKTREHRRDFDAAALRDVSPENVKVVKLAIKGIVADRPKLLEGDPEIAADKVRRLLEAEGLGDMLKATKQEAAKPKPTGPTTPASGKKDYSTVKSLSEVSTDEYDQVPDAEWRRLTGQ